MNTEVELISPAHATQYLTRNIKNRKLRENTVRLFAREMEHGRWYLHHQGIAFNEDGDLIDGQHRLTAIVLAGKTVQMNVTRNVRDNGTKAAHFIDIGNKRSMGDQLSITTGLKNANAVVASARAICEICYTDGKNTVPSLPIVEKVLGHYHEQIDLAIMALQVHPMLKKAAVVGTMAFCMKVYSGVLRFAEGVGTGEMLESHSPELTLRNYLLLKREGVTFKKRNLAETVASAVRAYLDDKPYKMAQRSSKALQSFRDKQKSTVEEIRGMLEVSSKKMP